MSNKEGNGTRDILDSSNYKLWKQELYLLLKENKLEQHILREVIKIVPAKDLTDEQKTTLTLVDESNDL